ncbi:thermostable hemolysin [Shewanella surugensis]|uniref:Thermostable hemolysin n=1 Tax=Shewanella surugensis TaxID=212020 RepID=A0ABT0L9H9_9GAMM|nr:thermostable hemolysin [Shewanella surugensis]MCL1124357.1 thermostable hemolysin [Shewanella surugensis]
MLQTHLNLDYSNEKVKNQFFKKNHIAIQQHQFHIHINTNSQREKIECYIARKFQQIHQAKITHFMPILLEMSLKEHPQAVVGLMPGSSEKFFLEQYLSVAAETLISTVTHQPIERHSIVEIGNLAITHNGSGLILFSLMANMLINAHYQWIIFTATDEVKRLLRRLNIELIPIADAHPEINQNHWGSYYNNNPQVITADLKKITANNAQILNRIKKKYQNNIDEISRQFIKNPSSSR